MHNSDGTRHRSKRSSPSSGQLRFDSGVIASILFPPPEDYTLAYELAFDVSSLLIMVRNICLLGLHVVYFHSIIFSRDGVWIAN
jgi:hypothetical protein